MNATMPGLERLAREGLVFTRAATVAPLTLPAHSSLFTGLLPMQHGVRDNGDGALDLSHVTLAEVLNSRGYRTAAFVGSQILAADRGLAQGFELYRSATSVGRVSFDRPERRADAVVSDAIGWLEDVDGDERFFLWVHLYDPHRPYDPPEPFRSKYVDPYVGEIAFADSQIARLVDVLEHRRLLERTIVVVAGDHGESLGDHGERDHGMSVYESVLRVPLIMRVPNTPPKRLTQLVRLTDLLPTVLALLGVRPGSDRGQTGVRPVSDHVSARPALHLMSPGGSDPGLTPVRPPSDPGLTPLDLTGLIAGTRERVDVESYAETLYPERFGKCALRTLRDRRFKFIAAPRPELYDLERDPFEERNLYDERPGLAAAIEKRLAALTRTDTASAPDRSPLSVDLRERLAALGYVHADRLSHRKD
jgi:choline-sulfatase